MNEEITKLTEIWYRIVNLDHHKDRDCHWYINTVYSYGNPPIYRVEHYGYIHKEIGEEFDTYEKAAVALKGFIEEAIGSERVWAKNVISGGKQKGWDSDQIEQAEGILKLSSPIKE